MQTYRKSLKGMKFTQMQFRILAELVVGKMCSMDAPPSKNSKKGESPVVQALTDATTAT